ncbi:bifunctional phosphatase PAP2/diacylglycerol kinase family protein [Actinomadura barringtoniae]|uniref:bifunctional phosphatase PAP2/diacylglycerol kinase family protein n=1 Tax=Actinomadura barringtoniae TaxID=1427535 RepID=UPI0027DDC219|nr:phosphatase PAP2 family protein [Actinomadura barringtoniae]
MISRLSKIDRKAFDRVAAAHLPGLENVLPRLSRLADHGVLWFSVAAGLAATRRPSLRRAALRGTLAIAVASPVVNILGKQAFRRQRPVVDLVPAMRIRWKLPTSHAFPSGHSASAAGFATGVAMEAPRAVAVPVAATAAAVAFSRVYTGAHYPGDVLAGLGIGVAAGLGTRMAWQARPPVAHASKVATTDIEITEDGRGVVVVINDKAGAGGGDGGGARVPRLSDLEIALLERDLPAAEIVRVGPEGDLLKELEEAAVRAEVLGVMGGDGTINAGAKVALRHDVPMLPIPGGTLNHFTRALGLETAADAVAAYKKGGLAKVDVGSVTSSGGDELVFLNTASFGAYTELVHRRERLEGRLGKWPALAVAAVRTLRHSEPVDVLVDGERRKIWLAFVGNGMYGSRGAAPTWRGHLDDGQLDVRIVTAARRYSKMRALASVMAGHLHAAPGYHAWHGTTLELSSLQGSLPVAVDGELMKMPPKARFGKRAGALAVFTPSRTH